MKPRDLQSPFTGHLKYTISVDEEGAANVTIVVPTGTTKGILVEVDTLYEVITNVVKIDDWTKNENEGNWFSTRTDWCGLPMIAKGIEIPFDPFRVARAILRNEEAHALEDVLRRIEESEEGASEIERLALTDAIDIILSLSARRGS